MGRLSAQSTSAYWTPERRARQAERTRRRLDLDKVGPRDVGRLLRRGHVAPALRPLVRFAQAEQLELVAALGGSEISPQRRLVVEDIALLGVALRGVFARYCQTNDEGERAELASRMATLASVRRQSLVAIGLARVARELDLNSYLREREGGLQAADGQPVDNQPENPEAPRAVAADPQTGELGVAPEGEVVEGKTSLRPEPPPPENRV